MVDLTNAPEGATHYGLNYVGEVCWYKIRSRGYKYCYNKDVHTIGWAEGHYQLPMHEYIKIDNWSIYNNTLPLSELSDEQRGLLFNHKCNGGDIEAKSAIGWLESSLWNMSWVYRAKQKTERELFIDEWSIKIATNEYNGWNVRSLVGMMFDGIKGDK